VHILIKKGVKPLMWPKGFVAGRLGIIITSHRSLP